MKMSEPPRRVKSGMLHTHKVTASWSGFNHSGRAIPTVHHGALVCHTAIEKDLLELYRLDRHYGGDADINWAWRASLFVYYCEPCETMFWLHQTPESMPEWPKTYHPVPYVAEKIRAHNAGL